MTTNSSNPAPAQGAPTLSPNGRAALIYARLGHAVLPDAPGGKRPLIVDWVNRASRDPERISELWTATPDANVGLATGHTFFALDVDPRNGGVVPEGLPRTPQASTPSGGSHFLFNPIPGLTNSAGKLGPGLDIRGEGGQIVVAPSSTAAGSYRWVVAPWDCPLADAPAWLVQRLTTRGQISDSEPGERPTFPPATPEVLARVRKALDRQGPAVSGEGGDLHTFVACALLVNDFALTDDEAWPLLAEWNKLCEPPWDEYALAAKMHGAAKYASRPFGCARTEGERPSIQIVAGRLAEIATSAEKALVSARVPVFSRGGRLVRAVMDEVDASHGRRTKVSRFTRVESPYLRDLLSRHVEWLRWNAKSEEFVTADPPLDVATTILAREGEWLVQPTVGVINTPTMRPDGTILDRPGFDPQTRLLLLDAPPMPAIPDAPTRDDALRELALLNGLLSEFPWVDEPSRSVGLSALITPVVRGAFSVAPGHAFSASTPGTGKSYAVDTAAGIAIGQPCPVITATSSPEELEKRLGSAAMAGQPLISLDNVSTTLGGDALCQLVERPAPQVRVLGRSELVRVEARSTVFATGNNLLLQGDVTRRFLLARLEANLERPELRQFRGNPFATVLANRGRYVAAALTIVRAYVVAGRPSLAPRLASFEGWSDNVRSALMWLGRADPCATMEAARAGDPLMELHRAVLRGWSEVFGVGQQGAKTAADVVRAAEFGGQSAIAEPVLTAASNRGRPDVRTFGKWLSRHRDRILDGVRLRGASDAHGHATRWWVESAVTAVTAVGSQCSQGERS